jgi:hypothetical protein
VRCFSMWGSASERNLKHLPRAKMRPALRSGSRPPPRADLRPRTLRPLPSTRPQASKSSASQRSQIHK